MLYFQPDAYVLDENGALSVVLNDFYLPRLTLSSQYEEMMHSADAETASYLRRACKQAQEQKGGNTKLMTNVGQTSNRGIELQLNAWLIETKDFSLNATFNIGHNKNKIDKLASGEKEWILTSAWRNDVVNSDDYRAYVGGTSGLIYGYVNDGFYTVADFESFDSKSRTWKLKEGVVDSSPLSDTPRPGNAKFKKLTPVDPNSTNPYQLTEADRTVIGNTTPKFSGGFGLNATYKGFDMSMFFNFMYDFDVLNANKIMLTTWADNKENNFLMDIASEFFVLQEGMWLMRSVTVRKYWQNSIRMLPCGIPLPSDAPSVCRMPWKTVHSCVLIQLPSVTPYQVCGRRKSV